VAGPPGTLGGYRNGASCRCGCSAWASSPWQGRYDGGAIKAPVSTNNIPFWWDIVVVAVFSLLIYLWAMRTKLPREEMLDLVNKQAAEHGPEPLPSSPGAAGTVIMI
jgi:hypothetical protein